ncbi:MAG: hypothetical protein AVDCRST_MAG66-4186, partial [uncultured Pseudonocardia sp.]
ERPADVGVPARRARTAEDPTDPAPPGVERRHRRRAAAAPLRRRRHVLRARHAEGVRPVGWSGHRRVRAGAGGLRLHRAGGARLGHRAHRARRGRVRGAGCGHAARGRRPAGDHGQRRAAGRRWRVLRGVRRRGRGAGGRARPRRGRARAHRGRADRPGAGAHLEPPPGRVGVARPGHRGGGGAAGVRAAAAL